MKLLAQILTVLLFIGPVVLSVLNWPIESDSGNNRPYPSLFILVIYIFWAFFLNKLNKRNNRWALIIVITAFFTYIGSKLLGRSLNSMVLLNSISLPALYFIFFNSNKLQNMKQTIKKTLIVSFIINTIIAVYERLTMKNIFPISLLHSNTVIDYTHTLDSFRSNSLLGHPLSNALITSIVMIFVLTSTMNYLKKYFLYYIGMLSIFCYNARAAIMISGVTLVLYLLRPIIQNKHTHLRNKFVSIFVIFLSIFIAAYLFYSGYGNRFEVLGDFSTDGSTLARVNIWKVFSYMDYSEILFGISNNEIYSLTERTVGMAHVENWFIMIGMCIGFILTIFFIVLFIPLFKKALTSFDKYTSFLIIIVVIGLASTNNSLSCGVPAIATFFVCSYAFANINDSNGKTESVLLK